MAPIANPAIRPTHVLELFVISNVSLEHDGQIQGMHPQNPRTTSINIEVYS